MTAMLEPRVEAREQCPRCHEPVLLTVGQDKRRKQLAPTPVAGGMYTLNSHGVAVRRPIIELSREIRSHAAVYGGGLEAHVCPKRPGEAQ